MLLPDIEAKNKLSLDQSSQRQIYITAITKKNHKMLDKIRHFSQGFVTKIIISLIILSFLFIGVGDFFQSRLGRHVAKIGDQKISEFQLSNKIEQLQRNPNYQNMDAETLRLVALRNIVNKTILELEAENLGIIISNDTAFDVLLNIPDFQNELGEFDQTRFKNFLLNQNLSEQDIFNNLQKSVARDLVQNTVNLSSFTFPEYFAAQLTDLFQVRDITLLKYQLPKNYNYIANPQESELVDFYEQNKADYFIPEKRITKIIDFTCKGYSNKINNNFSQSELRSYYDAHLNEFSTPEEREILQILVKDEAASQTAYQKLEAGADFEQLATDLDINQADLNLGKQQKENIFADFAKVIFTLDEQEYSKPVQGPFGWHIFKVEKIYPSKAQNFAAVKTQIKNLLTKEQACSKARKDFDQAELSIDQIRDIAELNNSYNAPNLTIEVTADSDLSNILPAAQAQELKEEILSTNKQNFIISKFFDSENAVIYQIDNIVAARHYTIDEIKGKISDSWKAAQHKDKHSETFTKIHNLLADSTNQRKTIKQFVNKYNNLTVKKIDLDRNNLEYPREFITDIFQLKESGQISKIFFAADEQFFYSAIFNDKRNNNPGFAEQEIVKDQLRGFYTQYLNQELYVNYLDYLLKQNQVEIRSQNAAE